MSATLLTLAVPACTVFMTFTNDAGVAQPLWKIFWPAFGAANQLLAALSLAGMTVWLKTTGRSWWITGVPAVFMSAVSVGTLVVIIRRALSGGGLIDPIGTTAVLLLILAILVFTQSLRAFFSPKRQSA